LRAAVTARQFGYAFAARTASPARGASRRRSNLVRNGRLARAFRRAERAVAGQDLNEGTVAAKLLRAPIDRVALIRADRAGVDRFLLDGAGAQRQFHRVLHRLG